METAVTNVLVESDGEGCLVVRWELQGDGAVDIAVGPTPEGIDHAHTMCAPAGERSARLTDLAPGRHYVSVAPHEGGSAVVAAERRLPFEGVTNFRDLGGYPTSSGGRTRWGHVFRADALHHLTPSDLDAFERLGLRVVYDLRTDDEREREPNPMHSRHVSLLSRRAAGETPDWSGFQQTVDGERWLHERYLDMLATAGPFFGRLLAGLAGPDGVPAVFHCAAGKDRTGLAAALLLTWLDVDRDAVLDDYELTGECWTIDDDRSTLERLVATGMSAVAAASTLGSPRWVMAETLAVLDDEYGGVEAYLRGPARMEQATLDQLRRVLVR
ncbi:MAG: tyrosine-protein phosphatase [Acidimicrobiia bacterium]